MKYSCGLLTEIFAVDLLYDYFEITSLSMKLLPKKSIEISTPNRIL